MKRLAGWLFRWLFERVALQRDPDFIVGDEHDPYLHRWWLIPRNKVFNLYLHEFLRDDDDRALHDHPWVWCSFLLRGAYVEHTIAAGGVHVRRRFEAGSLRVHGPRFAHRIELESIQHKSSGGMFKGPAWTLFITGPRLREWGFHCPTGWRHWRIFTHPANTGRVGAGCES